MDKKSLIIWILVIILAIIALMFLVNTCQPSHYCEYDMEVRHCNDLSDTKLTCYKSRLYTHKDYYRCSSGWMPIENTKFIRVID